MSDQSINAPARLALLPGANKRIMRGYLWGFSNEIHELKGFAPGQLVHVFSADREFLGTGYVNPHSLISLRMLSSSRIDIIDTDFFIERLSAMRSLRERFSDSDHYRLCHGEGDNLPGLIIDRYGDVFSVQLTTAGLDVRRDAFESAMNAVFDAPLIVYRNDTPARKLEGLSEEVFATDPTFTGETDVLENGLVFRVNLLSGQKTGYFFDQKANRALVTKLSRDRSVVDACCYVGGWGVHALAGGARSVTFVDVSEHALAAARENVIRNGFDANTCRFVQVDATEFLREQSQSSERTGVMVVDPPAFVKTKKTLNSGEKGYINLNKWAMRATEPDGIMCTFSCSHHMDEPLFAKAVSRAARTINQPYRILAKLQQNMDHPVHPMMPETSYLKGLVVSLT